MEIDNKPRKNVGGWRGSPNSIAALLAGQVLLQFQRKCELCGRVAMRGRRCCVWHAGVKLRDGLGRVERRQIEAMRHLGLMPAELANARRRAAPIALHLALMWHDRERQPLAFHQAWRRWIDATKA
jgi:hypothetical protein